MSALVAGEVPSAQLAKADLAVDLGYRLARAAPGRGAARGASSQAREASAANTAAAAPRPEFVHPGVQRYLPELGLMR